MKDLSFLYRLEVAQKFVVEEPKIILQSQRLYGVERDFSDQLKPKPSWTISNMENKFEKEKALMKMHRTEVKYWRNDLGKERKQKMKLEPL